MIAPARRAALNALVAVTAGRADLPAAVAAERSRLRDERDRSLASEISIGTLRWMGELDHIIAAFSTRPLDRLDPPILNILRLAVYQLLHLDRIPAAAVVDDAVSQARAAGKSSAAGFVNGLLRSVVRRKQSLPLPPRPGHSADFARDSGALDYLSITLSHPRWLVERWLGRMSFDEVETWLHFNNSTAPLTLRINARRTTRDQLMTTLASHGITVTPTVWAPDGLVVTSGNPLTTDLPQGLFVVQDEASQLVPLLVAAGHATRILDACAAPGGKTIALANGAARSALVVACDLRPRRVRLLRSTLAGAGLTRAPIVRADVERALPFARAFDVVLLDAPCSGLGTLRRDPDIRWRRRPDDFARLAAAQKRMLDNVAAVLRPGGELVYSTCSSEPEENDAVVTAFLQANPAFRLVGRDDVIRRLPERAGPLIEESGFLRTSPTHHALEAFFGAVMRYEP